jgi:hypothetical protein
MDRRLKLLWRKGARAGAKFEPEAHAAARE